MNDFTAIPCITVIAYLAAEIFKLLFKNKNEYVPAFCGVVGAFLGLASYYLCPGFIPSANLFHSIATGILSGFSATGVNQVFKQTAQVKNHD